MDVNSYPNIPVAAPFPTMVASDNNHFFGLLTNVEMLKDYEQYNMITNQNICKLKKGITLHEGLNERLELLNQIEMENQKITHGNSKKFFVH